MLIQDKGTTSIGLVHEALDGALRRQLDTSIALQQARIDPEPVSYTHLTLPTKA